MGKVSKLVNTGGAYLKHRRFIEGLQNLTEQERFTRLGAYQEGLSGASRAGLQAMLAAKAKPENADASFLQSLGGRARVAMEARAASGPVAGGEAVVAAAAADPEVLFEEDRLLVSGWFPLGSDARRRAVNEHVGRLPMARHEAFVKHVQTMVENTHDLIAYHQANEDRAWGGYIEDRMSYNMARLASGGHDPVWTEQLRSMIEDGERFTEVGSIAVEALMARLDPGEPTLASPATAAEGPAAQLADTPARIQVLSALIEAEDPAGLAAVVTTWPLTSQHEEVLTAVAQPYPEIRMAGLNLLAQHYAPTAAAATALTIVEAVQTVARARYQRTGETPLLDVVAAAADIAATARATLGRADELVACAEEALRWLDVHGSTERRCNLYLWLAHTELERGALPRAEQHLVAAESLALSAADYGTRGRLEGLRKRYDLVATGTVIELASTSAGPSADDVQGLSDPLAAVASQASVLPPQQAAETARVIGVLQDGLGDLAKDPLGTNDSPIEALADLLGASDQPSSRIGLQKRIREAGRVLSDAEQGHDRALLGWWISELSEMAGEAQAHDLGNDLMTIRWCLQVCHRRRDEHRQAAIILHHLWQSLEEQRATIADSIERAGVLSQFPFLFQSLASSLYLSDQPTELLAAIEGAKGRLIEDRLERNRTQLPEVGIAHSSLSELPAALERAHAHYLTYLLDDDCVYAVLVAADRSIHATRIELDRVTLRTYGAVADPSKWGQRPGGFHAARNPSDLPERLAPLVSWLEPLVDSGVIDDADHLCYCPDEDLHLIPLHLLPVGDEPLLDRVSVSRVHSAWAVLNILSAPPAQPRGVTVVEVPSAEDPDEMTGGFSACGDCLLELLPGDRVSGTDGNLSRVVALTLTDRVVHFTTHGTFPTPTLTHAFADLDPNPFRSSGLLLADEGALPSKHSIARARMSRCLLSPERIMRLDFGASHVTMQACASGLSKEGAGGDALGVEWALLVSGAASILTTLWDASLASSSEFCRRFYDAWLDRDLSRAAAWRSTAREMRREGWPISDWAAIALSGDWR